MDAEETTEEVLEGHRPLPAVDMPLLKEHRRAIRVRRIFAAGGAVLALAGGATGVAWIAIDNPFRGDGPETDVPAPVAAAANDNSLATDGATPDVEVVEEDTEDEQLVLMDDGAPSTLGAESRSVRRFGQSRGFRDALTRAGTSPEDRTELEEALDEVMDFRRCRPNDQMIFERDAGGNLVLFEYRGGSATAYYRATRGPRGQLRGERVEIPVERRRLARGGTIRNSLGGALERAGFGRALVGVFIEVFEGQVNFSRRARSGDTFRLIVDEERVSGRFLRWGTVHALEYLGQRTGERRAFYYAPVGEEGDYYDETGRALQGGWLRTPVRYDRISSRFDPRRMHPILRRIVPHTGVDYAAGTGTPVWSAADGTVSFAGERGANGNLVTVRHANGYQSSYAHLLRIERGITRDVRVRRRQVIGYLGSTGRSTGPHLHFALKRNGRFIDPLEAINGPGRMMPAAALGRYRTHVRRLMRELGRIDVRAAAGPSTAAEEPEPTEPEPLGPEGSEEEVMD